MEFVTSKRIDKWVENHRKQGCVFVARELAWLSRGVRKR